MTQAADLCRGSLDSLEEQSPSGEPIIDPALSDQGQTTTATEAIAQPLNAPPDVAATQPADVDSTSAPDPIVRVASLAAANRGVVSVSVNETIDKATTLMFFENYSQLAVGLPGEFCTR